MKVTNSNGVVVDVSPILETHQVTLPAAAAATDSAVLVTLSANTAGRGLNGVLLEWIAAQGVLPTDLAIVIDGADWRRVDWPLPPNLYRAVGALGEGDHGVQVEIRNRRQVPVTVTLAVRGDANVRTEGLPAAAITAALPDVGARPVPADRTPTVQAIVAQVQEAGAHVSTIRGAYTVPTGRKARVSLVAARVHRMGAAGAGRMRVQAIYTKSGAGPLTWMIAQVYAATLGLTDRGEAGGGMDILSGDLVQIETSNDAVDPGDFYGAMHIMEYDA